MIGMDLRRLEQGLVVGLLIMVSKGRVDWGEIPEQVDGDLLREGSERSD